MTVEITLSTHLDAAPDHIWTHVGAPRLLHYVAHPILRFAPVEPPEWPERWEAGAYLCGLRLFGAIPIGRQVIDISFPNPDGARRLIRDNGRSALIKRWDHLLIVEPEGEGARYTDRLSLDAGWRTPFVAAFARFFYAHRQARWRKLVARGFDYGPGF